MPVVPVLPVQPYHTTAQAQMHEPCWPFTCLSRQQASQSTAQGGHGFPFPMWPCFQGGQTVHVALHSARPKVVHRALGGMSPCVCLPAYPATTTDRLQTWPLNYNHVRLPAIFTHLAYELLILHTGLLAPLGCRTRVVPQQWSHVWRHCRVQVRLRVPVPVLALTASGGRRKRRELAGGLRTDGGKRLRAVACHGHCGTCGRAARQGQVMALSAEGSPTANCHDACSVGSSMQPRELQRLML